MFQACLVGAALLIGLVVLCNRGSAKEESKSKKASQQSKQKKESESVKQKATANVAAESVVKASSAGASSATKQQQNAPVAVNAIASPTNVSTAVPEISSSGSDLKLKKPKETAEQKEARLQRQQAAKIIKKESESTARATNPPPAPVVVTPKKVVKVVEDEWEVVVDKKKDKPKKKVEQVEISQPIVVPKPVAAPSDPKETKNVSVDSRKVGAVIGPKGVTLRVIQDITGTEIQIPKLDPNQPTATVSVSVSGRSSGVSKAIQILSEISDTGISTALLAVAPQIRETVNANIAAPSVPSAETPVPAPVREISTNSVIVKTAKMGVIIGPKGATLHALQDATSTEINTALNKGSNDTTTVIIAGPAEGVAKATKAVNELAAKGYCLLLSGENFQESSISIPPRSFLCNIIYLV